LCDEEERGGLPVPEVLAGGTKIPCPFPPETLPSPVIDDMKDDEEDMLKDDKSTPPDLLLLLQLLLLLLLLTLLLLFFETPRERNGTCCDFDCDCDCDCDCGCDFSINLLGFVKSKVRDLGSCLTLAGMAGFWGSGASTRLGCGDPEEEDEEERERLGLGLRLGFEGARRNRAWPVRLSTEISRLNLETVASVTSLHSASSSILFELACF